MLITSLALLARRRAWVVFRRVGVAAPARRRFRGIAQWMTGGAPDRFRVGRGCRAAARALTHLGSERDLRGLGEITVPPLLAGRGCACRAGSVAPARPLGWHAIFFGNLRATVDPVVGGSLEDASWYLL